MKGPRRPNADWLTTGEVARAIGASDRLVRDWVDKGLLPGHRLPGGRDRRILASHFAEFCERHNLTAVGLPRPVRVHDEVAGAVVVAVEEPDCLMRCECQATFRASSITVATRSRMTDPPPLRCPSCRVPRVFQGKQRVRGK